MKIVIDEHIPPAMARAFERFAEEQQFKTLMAGIEIELVQTYYPSQNDPDYAQKSDEPWIRRFAKAGGRFIISGNTAMMKVPHERTALVQEGMTVFFFGSQWNEWKFFHKCALMMAVWPLIVEEMRRRRIKPRFWRIPSSFALDAKLFSVSVEDAKALKIARQKAKQKKVAKARKQKRSEGVPDLFSSLKKKTRGPRKRKAQSDSGESR